MITLYKLDIKGKMREWTIERLDGKYRVITGLLDGKKVTSDWTHAQPTNVGRANERDIVAQADFEVAAMITEKQHEGYRASIEEAQVFDKPFEPMLADKYAGWSKLKYKNIYSQPKLDGIRCNAKATGLWSRSNKPILAVPHIWEAVKPFVDAGWVVDGELYNHSFRDDFNSITSLVRKQKPDEAELAQAKELIQYHIYDMFDPNEPDLPFSERVKKFIQFSDTWQNNPNIPLRAVVTNNIENKEDLEARMAEYLDDGYEGQMLRDGDSAYDQKRSKSLLKHKPKGYDEELEIVEVLEGQGNWSNKAKMIVVKWKDGTCRATIKGTMEYCTEVWQNKEAMKGKKATVWYQNLTPDGIPRFPIAKELDRWDG